MDLIVSIPLINFKVDIWEWCKARGIWLSVYHIPGGDNYTADSLLRQTNEDMEWSLDIDAFQLVQLKLGITNTDLFASEQNHKLSQYVFFHRFIVRLR